MVKLPNGKQVYFRFYDPTVLRQFLPACLSKEAREFFGPVRSFLMETEAELSLLKVTITGEGIQKTVIDLAGIRSDRSAPTHNIVLPSGGP